MAVSKRTHQSVQDTKAEGARMLQFLRALGTEDQRIAYAVLEGMQLQRKLDQQRGLWFEVMFLFSMEQIQKKG